MTIFESVIINFHIHIQLQIHRNIISSLKYYLRNQFEFIKITIKTMKISYANRNHENGHSTHFHTKRSEKRSKTTRNETGPSETGSGSLQHWKVTFFQRPVAKKAS